MELIGSLEVLYIGISSSQISGNLKMESGLGWVGQTPQMNLPITGKRESQVLPIPQEIEYKLQWLLQETTLFIRMVVGM